MEHESIFDENSHRSKTNYSRICVFDLFVLFFFNKSDYFRSNDTNFVGTREKKCFQIALGTNYVPEKYGEKIAIASNVL